MFPTEVTIMFQETTFPILASIRNNFFRQHLGHGTLWTGPKQVSLSLIFMCLCACVCVHVCLHVCMLCEIEYVVVFTILV